MQDFNTRIASRSDTRQNWELNNPILLQGEIAIVFDGNNQLFKVGDGQKHFNELQYSFYDQFASEQINTSNLRAKSISQGYGSNVNGIGGIATGYKSQVNSNFAQSHGYQANVSSDFGYVWNGNNQISNYADHGAGSFNINPKNGLSGFYIGDNNLSNIIKTEIDSLSVSISSEYVKISVDNNPSQDFKFIHISYDEYAKLIVDDRVDPHTMYILSGDGVVDQFGNRIINVGSPISASDAANKGYVDESLQNSILDYVSILRPDNEHRLNIKVDIYDINNNELEISVNSKSNPDYFKQFTGTDGWENFPLDGSSVECKNLPVIFNIKKVFIDNSKSLTNSDIKYLKYTWYYEDDSGIEHSSDPYSMIYPSYSETGANSNNSVGKNEFQKLVQNVIVETYLASYDEYLQGSYKCFSTKYNILQNDVEDQDVIILCEYNEHKTYKIKFKVNSREDVSIQFYKELDDGNCVLDEILTSDIYKFSKSGTYVLTICDQQIKITTDDVYQDIGGNVGKLLSDKSYDFSNNASIYNSLKDILQALGASVTNVPSQNL